MPDDQVGQRMTGRRQGVTRGRSQRQQGAFGPERPIEFRDPVAGVTRCRAAAPNKSAHFAKAGGTRDEDRITGLQRRSRGASTTIPVASYPGTSGYPMPGNGGIRPSQNSFSVPVEMPEWLTSTTTSPAVGAVKLQGTKPQRSRTGQNDGCGLHGFLLWRLPVPLGGDSVLRWIA